VDWWTGTHPIEYVPVGKATPAKSDSDVSFCCKIDKRSLHLSPSASPTTFGGGEHLPPTTSGGLVGWNAELNFAFFGRVFAANHLWWKPSPMAIAEGGALENDKAL
jgi:hypothetical protein